MLSASRLKTAPVLRLCFISVSQASASASFLLVVLRRWRPSGVWTVSSTSTRPSLRREMLPCPLARVLPFFWRATGLLVHRLQLHVEAHAVRKPLLFSEVMTVRPPKVAPFGSVPHAFAVGAGVPLSLRLFVLHATHYGDGL